MLLNENLIEKTQTGYKIALKKKYRAVYGFGEKFDSCNQKGKYVRACVREKCFRQGEYTYLSMPFFFTPDGFGMYVDTYVEVDFDFRTEGEVTIEFPRDSFGNRADVHWFEGTPKQIIEAFRSVCGMPRLFPKWVLGAWMSSNRWHTQAEVEEQVALTKKFNFPHSVLVIEPWSDCTTHYLWHGCTCTEKEGDEAIHYSDLDFSGSVWPDPKEMVEMLHEENLKLLLWIVPIYAQKSLESDCNVQQILKVDEYVKEHGECVMNADGSPYEIPHTWCIGDLVPDFTNPVAKEHWFAHFQHLKDIGIDGFKTDGGEFIHDHTVKFHDGTTGLEGQNAFCEQYIRAFADFIGEEGIVFSRAGGQRAPTCSVIWSGDQESTWSEFASVIKAGISAGLSGIGCWGFDIAGFSGYLPSEELFRRAVETAAFVPVMQWHSEAVSNGRCDFTGAWPTNDRSPWNIAAFHKKGEEFLSLLRDQFRLHYNLLPYQYMLLQESSRTGISPMRHLVLEFPEEEGVYEIDNEFMLGDALLIAPVLNDYISSQKVYLPEDTWFHLFTGQKYTGGVWECSLERTPVFLRNNKCVPLNLSGGKLCSDVGSELDGYKELTFLVSGTGCYEFSDDLGNSILLEWDEKSDRVLRNERQIKVKILHIERTKLL